MHARVTRLQQSPDRVDETIAAFESTIAPSVRAQAGCAGLALAVDRDEGTFVTLTLWESAEDMQASEENALRLRDMAERDLGLQVASVGRVEVCHLEGTFDPGTFSRVVSGEFPPGRVAEIEQEFRERVVPLLKSQRGFCRAACYLDRQVGTVIAASGWRTAADREASDAAIAPIRRELAERMQASGPMRVDLYELVSAEVRAGVMGTRS